MSTTPDQLQAIQAILQQGLAAGADTPAPAALPVSIQTSPIDLSALIQVITLKGTAVQADLEQILLKTAQGDFVVTPQPGQNAQADISSQLPARVTLQIKNTADGLQALLVLDAKNVKPPELPQQPATTIGPAQILTPEIPKVGEIHQALVLPATMFSVTEWQASKSAGVPVAAPQVKETPESLEKAAQRAASTGASPIVMRSLPPVLQSALAPILQRMNITVSQPAEITHAATYVQMAAPVNAASVATNTNNDPAPKDPAPTTTTVKVVTVTPPDAQGKAVPITSDKTTFLKTVNATVIANTPSGQPIVQIEGDDNALVLAVKTGKPWPVGTQVQLEVGRSAEHVTLKDLGLPDHKKWEALKQLMEQTNPQNAAILHEMARLRMPQANPTQMPGALLFLFNALQKNNFSAWLGKDTEDKLKQIGRAGMLAQLQEEFQASRITGHDPVNGEWKGFVVPFLDQDKMQTFRFYVHQEPFQKNKNKNSNEWARRFLIEINLSKLGPVQVEGLVHKKKLDLVVRTDMPLDTKLQADLNASFAKSMDDIHYSGLLLFRAGKNGWIDMQEAQQKHVSAAL